MKSSARHGGRTPHTTHTSLHLPGALFGFLLRQPRQRQNTALASAEAGYGGVEPFSNKLSFGRKVAMRRHCSGTEYTRHQGQAHVQRIHRHSTPQERSFANRVRLTALPPQLGSNTDLPTTPARGALVRNLASFRPWQCTFSHPARHWSLCGSEACTPNPHSPSSTGSYCIPAHRAVIRTRSSPASSIRIIPCTGTWLPRCTRSKHVCATQAHRRSAVYRRETTAHETP
jgi:hypothetical protein